MFAHARPSLAMHASMSETRPPGDGASVSCFTHRPVASCSVPLGHTTIPMHADPFHVAFGGHTTGGPQAAPFHTVPSAQSAPAMGAVSARRNARHPGGGAS